MREIEFRGFREDENGKDHAFYNGEWHAGEWCYGYYTEYSGAAYGTVIETETDDRSVDPATVGQYTGKTDRKKKRVFDGDRIALFLNYGNNHGVDPSAQTGTGVVMWDDHDSCYVVKDERDKTWNTHITDFGNLGHPEYFEVIGNIHEQEED